MKIMLCPDSFKGSLTQNQAIHAMKDGISDTGLPIETDEILVADGGEGTLDAVAPYFPGEIITRTVSGPYGEKVEARYLLGGEKAFIELAEASGLNRTALRDVARASTIGTGQLVKDALENGAKTIYMAFGGSATNDGGAGILKALGFALLDGNGNETKCTNEGLSMVASIDAGKAEKSAFQAKFILACDVKNPLCGPEGASSIFGPQKGATEADITFLDENLRRFGTVLENMSGKKVIDVEGSGAAGGATIPFIAIFDTEVKSGIDFIIELTGFSGRIRDCDMIFTGEGKYDRQTTYGKVISGIRKCAVPLGKRVVVFTGKSDYPEEDVYEIGDPEKDLEYNMSHAYENLKNRVMSFLKGE